MKQEVTFLFNRNVNNTYNNNILCKYVYNLYTRLRRNVTLKIKTVSNSYHTQNFHWFLYITYLIIEVGNYNNT